MPAGRRARTIAAISRASDEVRGEDAATLARSHLLRPDAGADHQRPDRPDPEHHHRIAKKAVAQPRLPGPGEVLLDRECGDVAGPASVEIAGAAVVDGMVVAPVRKGLEDEQPSEPANPEVRLLVRQEGAVGAVVEDDERPQQEARCRNCEGEGDPDRDFETEVHRHGYSQVGHHRGGQSRGGCDAARVARGGRPPRASRGDQAGSRHRSARALVWLRRSRLTTIFVPPKAHRGRKGTSARCR